MSRRSVLAARIRALFLRKRLERELDAEIRFHLEMQAEDNIRAGMDSRQATDAASRSFGGVMRTKETYRERRALHPFETIARDLRYALRVMRKNPSFTIVAILSLAIGIGANTAVFSIADALLLRPLPIPRPGEVVTVGSTGSIQGFSSLVASYRDYVDIRDRSKSFEGLAAFTELTVGFATERDALPKLRIGMLVSGNFFSVMRVEPRLGRTFRSDEAQVPGRDAVVILGHDFWEQQFGGERSILGRKVLLNGIEFTVIGVAPDSFPGLSQFVRFDFYAPLMMWPRLTPDPNARPLEARDARNLTIKGRLKPGVTMTEAADGAIGHRQGPGTSVSGHEPESNNVGANRAAGQDRGRLVARGVPRDVDHPRWRRAVRRVRQCRRTLDESRSGAVARDRAARGDWGRSVSD